MCVGCIAGKLAYSKMTPGELAEDKKVKWSMDCPIEAADPIFALQKWAQQMEREKVEK
jgi:hypothetical protein